MLANCFLKVPQAIVFRPHRQWHALPSAAPTSPHPAALCRIFPGSSNDLLKSSRHHGTPPISIRFASLHRTDHRPLALSKSSVELTAAQKDDEEDKKLEFSQSISLLEGIKRMQERFLNGLLSFGKWLLLIAAVQYTLSEVAYAVVHGPELLMPLGLLVGVAFAGVAGEAIQELYGDNKYRPVPYTLLMLFFALIKFMGPALPKWGLIFLPHFANGGLWQTYLWGKRQKSEYDVQECDAVSPL